MIDFRLPQRRGIVARQRDVDALAKEVNALRRVFFQPPLYANKTSSGTVVGIRERKVIPGESGDIITGGAAVRRFTLNSVEDDYLICNAPDDPLALTKIAKPTFLRKSTWEDVERLGIRYSFPLDEFGIRRAPFSSLFRLATTTYDTPQGQAEFEQTEAVIPRYQPEDAIYAVRVSNGTGVEIDIENPEEDGPLTEPVNWLDVNVDARGWAQWVLR